jgi:membrane fusion protein, multidrug efflux system
LQREAAAALAQLDGNPDMPIDQQSTVQQAQAAVDSAARNLRLTSIVAPFDGIPNNVESIAVGAFLNAGQSAFPLVSTHDLYVEANIRETDLTYVRLGNPANVSIDAYPDTPIAAKVTTRPRQAVQYSRCCRRRMPPATGSRSCSAYRFAYPSASFRTASRYAPA